MLVPCKSINFDLVEARGKLRAFIICDIQELVDTSIQSVMLSLSKEDGMIEKALLLAFVALAMFTAVSEIGNQLSKNYTLLECKWSGKTICIIHDPN